MSSQSIAQVRVKVRLVIDEAALTSVRLLAGASVQDVLALKPRLVHPMQYNLQIICHAPMTSPKHDSGFDQSGQSTPPSSTWLQRHVSWLAPSMISLIGIFGVYYLDSSTKANDEHINTLISQKLDPKIDEVNRHTDTKVDGLGTKIDGFSSRLDGLAERIARIEGPLEGRVVDLEEQATRQSSLAKLQDPGRVLTLIREEIANAQKDNRPLPASQLVDYRNAVQELPSSAYEYWTTVATVINYQSHLLQMAGEAPDPMRVSRPCGGLTRGTGGHNYYENTVLSNCVVDLGSTSNVYKHVTFRNSVINYAGGPVNLEDVRFENCNFQLSLSSQKAPERPKFLLALLSSKPGSVSID